MFYAVNRLIELLMKPAFSNRFLPFVIFAAILFTAIFFAALNIFSPPQIIPCADIWANHLILALTLAFVLQTFLVPIISSGYNKFFLAIHAVLILSAIWFGVYSISPLGYSSGRIPNLSGFLVITANRNFAIANKETVSLTRGSIAAISPLMLAGEFRCNWMSAAGGALDTPSSCDMVYVAPNADYDVLRVHIRSSCGLPDSIGQIKVYILP